MAIEKGSFSVRVAYHIEDRKLAAENNVYLDQLTFGEKVDSPSATHLPVLFAVALLKDKNASSTWTCRSEGHSTTRSSASAASL